MVGLSNRPRKHFAMEHLRGLDQPQVLVIERPLTPLFRLARRLAGRSD